MAIGIALLVGGLAWAVGKSYAESLPKLYRSEVTFSVSKAADARKDLRGFSQTQQEDIELRLLSQQIVSDAVLKEVTAAREDRRVLRQRIIVEPVGETRLIQVKVDARQPEQASDLANRVAASYAVFKKQEAEELHRMMINLLEQEHEVNQLNYHQSLQQQRSISVSDRSALELQTDIVKMHAGLVQVTQERLDALRTRQDLGGIVQIVESAKPAEQSAYPNVVLIASFFAAGGSLTGFALAVVFFALNRKEQRC